MSFTKILAQTVHAVQNEPHLRLLSYQYNSLTALAQLDNLPLLAFLDCYANNLRSLPDLSCLSSLRILMLGRNQLSSVEGVQIVLPS